MQTVPPFVLSMLQLELHFWSSAVHSAVHIRPKLPETLGDVEQTV